MRISMPLCLCAVAPRAPRWVLALLWRRRVFVRRSNAPIQPQTQTDDRVIHDGARASASLARRFTPAHHQHDTGALLRAQAKRWSLARWVSELPGRYCQPSRAIREPNRPSRVEKHAGSKTYVTKTMHGPTTNLLKTDQFPALVCKIHARISTFCAQPPWCCARRKTSKRQNEIRHPQSPPVQFECF